MKNILNTDDRDRILARINALQGNEHAQWGKMTVAQMVCHVADQIRIALGDIEVNDRSSFITRTLAIRIVLLGLPVPRGKVRTTPEIELTEGHGTQPTTFEHDTATLKETIAAFWATDDDFTFQPHSTFGSRTRQQWGRLIYLHLDYHLQQFGR